MYVLDSYVLSERYRIISASEAQFITKRAQTTGEVHQHSVPGKVKPIRANSVKKVKLFQKILKKTGGWGK